VVSEQVRRHLEQFLQLRGGRFAQGQGVDDRQPGRVAQGGVHPRAARALVTYFRRH
jgi:hypothetical protein